MKDGVKGSQRPAGLRASRVADTEQRILDAAAELFTKDGYAATTLTAIAEAAGVGHRTVYVRFGTKAELLKRALDIAVAGDALPIDVRHRDWFETALSAPRPAERIDALSEGVAELMERAGALFAVARQAEPVEPLIAEAAQRGREATRDNLRAFVDKLDADRLLPGGSDPDWLAATATLAVQAETCLLLRQTHGWGTKQYRAWLRRTLGQLLGA
ncbi:TetR/AcrR family transcriptional regulator [Arthrobacter sp. SW1]|uniref:TetR/AcrR family transcriptional regulator n=1 Tax=Arthrobacter sp. SW1 TaxID=1920889 RepID=UPI00111321DC|nr:TetR/AcrR family transcriptional regulator [Arthrobacter sp. SW1]